MFTTSYAGITTMHKKLPYDGGICRWWYIPIEFISTWPPVDPQTQFLSAEPILAGKSWFGPVAVPDKELGFTESQERAKAGVYWKQLVEGYLPGDSALSRVNIENMAFHQYAIVAKQRAGGLFLLIGNEESGLDFDANYATGKGNFESSGSKLAFSTESISKAFVLPDFQGINVLPPINGDGSGGGYGGPTGKNTAEIIEFFEQSSLTFSWTTGRKNTFGSYPEIQVWFLRESGDSEPGYDLANVPIYVDAKPPSTNNFTVDFTGPATGFVVIK